MLVLSWLCVLVFNTSLKWRRMGVNSVDGLFASTMYSDCMGDPMERDWAANCSMTDWWTDESNLQDMGYSIQYHGERNRKGRSKLDIVRTNCEVQKISC